ncbi:MAG: DUF4124 domain-containing protein [Betaproteobacteria bacterium]|nr:DUF4124 domain-containing protein [Betaproteobacteria bacterium]
MRARLIALFLLAAAGLLSNATANADILRCNDANGNALYTDSACPAGMRAVGVTSFPLSCATEDCERRRERDLNEAYERVRAEKAQLAAYTAERHKRELEDRWLDEARYEAELHSAEAAQASSDEVVYPAYSLVGIPSRCGKHCFAFPQHRHFPLSRIGDVDHGHDHMKGPGNRREVRAVGNEPRRPLRGTTAGKRTVPL